MISRGASTTMSRAAGVLVTLLALLSGACTTGDAATGISVTVQRADLDIPFAPPAEAIAVADVARLGRGLRIFATRETPEGSTPVVYRASLSADRWRRHDLPLPDGYAAGYASEAGDDVQLLIGYADDGDGSRDPVVWRLSGARSEPELVTVLDATEGSISLNNTVLFGDGDFLALGAVVRRGGRHPAAWRVDGDTAERVQIPALERLDLSRDAALSAAAVLDGDLWLFGNDRRAKVPFALTGPSLRELEPVRLPDGAFGDARSILTADVTASGAAPLWVGGSERPTVVGSQAVWSMSADGDWTNRTASLRRGEPFSSSVSRIRAGTFLPEHGTTYVTTEVAGVSWWALVDDGDGRIKNRGVLGDEFGLVDPGTGHTYGYDPETGTLYSSRPDRGNTIQHDLPPPSAAAAVLRVSSDQTVDDLGATTTVTASGVIDRTALLIEGVPAGKPIDGDLFLGAPGTGLAVGQIQTQQGHAPRPLVARVTSEGLLDRTRLQVTGNPSTARARHALRIAGRPTVVGHSFPEERPLTPLAYDGGRGSRWQRLDQPRGIPDGFAFLGPCGPAAASLYDPGERFGVAIAPTADPAAGWVSAVMDGVSLRVDSPVCHPAPGGQPGATVVTRDAVIRVGPEGTTERVADLDAVGAILGLQHVPGHLVVAVTRESTPRRVEFLAIAADGEGEPTTVGTFDLPSGVSSAYGVATNQLSFAGRTGTDTVLWRAAVTGGGA